MECSESWSRLVDGFGQFGLPATKTPEKSASARSQVPQQERGRAGVTGDARHQRWRRGRRAGPGRAGQAIWCRARTHRTGRSSNTANSGRHWRRRPTAMMIGWWRLSNADGLLTRFFCLGKLEVVPRNFLVTFANLLDQRAVSKPRILYCAGPILLGSDGGAPDVLAFFSTRGGEHTHTPLPPTPHENFQVFRLVHSAPHQTAGLIAKGSDFCG
jgi:hypothetical protein